MKKYNVNKSLYRTPFNRRSFIFTSLLFASNMFLTSCYQYRIKDGTSDDFSGPQSGYNINSFSDKSPIVNIFIDYLCKYCNIIYPKILDAALELEGIVTIKVRHFPNYVIHSNSIYASRAVYAASIRDKYIEMAQTIGKNYEYLNNSDLSIEEIHNYIYSLAEDLNLNREKFIQDYKSDEAFRTIKNDYNFGRKIGVHITPSFYTERGKIPGVDSESSVEEIVAHIRKSLGIQ